EGDGDARFVRGRLGAGEAGDEGDQEEERAPGHRPVRKVGRKVRVARRAPPPPFRPGPCPSWRKWSASPGSFSVSTLSSWPWSPGRGGRLGVGAEGKGGLRRERTQRRGRRGGSSAASDSGRQSARAGVPCVT